MLNAILNARAPHRRGYTLVELVAVLTLVAITSLVVTPVLNTVSRSRQAGLAREIDRRLCFARACSMTSGMPTGVTFDVAGGRIPVVRIAADGTAPSPMPGITGADRGPAGDEIASMFPGAFMTGADLDGSGSYDTLWFDYTGSPHLRTAAGAYAKALSQDAVITLDGGGTVSIRRITGLVER